MKLISWNVNGIRSVLGKGFPEYLAACGADVVCLQETKARPDQVDHVFDGYQAFWNPAVRPGYSGTLLLSRKKPRAVTCGIGRAEHDGEGRVLTAEFGDFFLVNVYTPNSKRELTRLEYRTKEWTPAFADYLTGLAGRKPVIFCGDMNVAHREVDLARPRENFGSAGFTREEREAFDRILERGFFDTFREREAGGGHYTWWSYQSNARERNIGWRIDYFCMSVSLRGALRSAFIEPHVTGSDHCPVGVTLDL